MEKLLKVRRILRLEGRFINKLFLHKLSRENKMIISALLKNIRNANIKITKTWKFTILAQKKG